MVRTIILLVAMITGISLLAQDNPIRTVVLINGTAHLVDVTPDGNITATYQKIDNYFTSSESHQSIVSRLSKDLQPSEGTFVFYEQEKDPVPSFSEENKRPIDIGNDQYIGFSPNRALLLKAAVDQIRIIARAYRSGTVLKVSISSFHETSYRSKSLATNRAQAIRDLLIAFGVPKSQITSVILPGTEDTKSDFVQVAFSN